MMPMYDTGRRGSYTAHERKVAAPQIEPKTYHLKTGNPLEVGDQLQKRLVDMGYEKVGPKLIQNRYDITVKFTVDSGKYAVNINAKNLSSLVTPKYITARSRALTSLEQALSTSYTPKA